MPEAFERLVGFARELRSAGLRPGTGAVADFCRAAALLGATEVYWAGRLTLVSRHSELAVYDRVFAGFFGDVSPARPTEQLRLVVGGPADERSGETGETAAPRPARASRIELLRHKRFDECTRQELRELGDAAAAFARSLPRRRTRRFAAARRGALDVRATLRRSLRTGGEPFERRLRARRDGPRRIVLLLDVSGSMSGTSRALLVLAHAVRRVHPATEVVCFGTRATTVTRLLDERGADDALARAAATVLDWDGGTRIGESLKQLLDDPRHRNAARGAIVIVCSDGLDVGEPELLRVQMERLGRLARSIVWLNPLKANPGYEPLARGMHAALPHVDVFAAGTDLAGLEAVARQLVARRS